jgi:ribosomal protein S18 acetylase RimI-like enzyme
VTRAVRVRDAVPADAPAIAQVHVRGWRHAYVGLVPQALLDSLDVEQKQAMWARAIGGEGPERGATLVSEDEDGAVTGFVQVGAASGDAPDPDLGVLYALYLEPTVIGTGVGRSLLAEATERMRGAGFTRACLDVLPANERARRVYERAGWHATGEPYVITHGEHVLEHQRYELEL